MPDAQSFTGRLYKAKCRAWLVVERCDDRLLVRNVSPFDHVNWEDERAGYEWVEERRYKQHDMITVQGWPYQMNDEQAIILKTD